MLTLREDLRPLGVIGAPAVPADLAFVHQLFQEVAYFRGLPGIVIILMELVQIDIVGL